MGDFLGNDLKHVSYMFEARWRAYIFGPPPSPPESCCQTHNLFCSRPPTHPFDHTPTTGPTDRTTHLKIIFYYFEVAGDIRIKLFLDSQGLTNKFNNVIKTSNIDPT